MFAPNKLIAALVAGPALVGAVLVTVAVPAQAATIPGLQIGTTSISVSSSGSTKVYVNSNNRATIRSPKLMRQAIGSRKVSLTGKVYGPRTGITNLKVWRWSVSGLKTYRSRSVPVKADGTYDLGRYQLGPNNAWVGDYRLSLQGMVDGQSREWFWRGNEWGTGSFAGGANDIRTASHVRINKDRNFKANFKFGSISGTVRGDGANGAKVSVAGAPYSMPTAKSDQRAMDYPYCADNFATVNADGGGAYEAKFLPKADGSDKRYAVHITPSSGNAGDMWNENFGSCLNARNYFGGNRNHNAYLLPAGATLSYDLAAPRGSVKGKINYSGVAAQTAGDKQVTLREFIPGRAVLDGPIVGSTRAASNGNYSFGAVKPGHYWLEVGRQTGCSWWYPSAYSNNSAYFNGLDRGDEIWKSFTTLSSLWKSSKRQRNGLFAWHQAYAHGATNAAQNHIPKGKAGWMYRDYCRTNVAGTYKSIWVSSAAGPQVTTSNPKVVKGGVLTGRVTRGKKSNKEMLVEVHSTNGTFVRRTAITDSNGYFRIYGIQPGNYTVEVNSDSWRGIGRTFTGIHTRVVGTSKTSPYSVGTLKANF